MKTQRSFCNRKMKHLRPLVLMPFYEVYEALEDKNATQLRALLRVFDELTDSNCWWAEYRFMCIFRPVVEKHLAIRTAKKRSRRANRPPR